VHDGDDTVEVDPAAQAAVPVAPAALPVPMAETKAERTRRTLAEVYRLWDLDLRDQAKRARIAAVDVPEPVDLEIVDEVDWMSEAAAAATDAWENLEETKVEDLNLVANSRKEIEEFKAFKAFTPVPADTVTGTYLEDAMG
jgi:hypothetical protein